MAGADYGQAVHLQNAQVAASIQNRRRSAAKALPQSLRIRGVRAAQHPNRPLSPALDRLAELETPGEESTEPVRVDAVRQPAVVQQLGGVRTQQFGWLPAVVVEPSGKLLVLLWLQHFSCRSTPADDQRRRQQEDGLRVG